MAANRRCSSDSVGISIDLTQWHMLKLTHEGQHWTGGRSLISIIALFLVLCRLSLLFIACKSSELCCISAGSKLTNSLSGNRNDMWPSKISGHLFETLE